MNGRVLVVAGSDSGGGAGIQADIKTITALDAYAATAVTALTAQNTLGVHGVVGIAPEFIAMQMRVVLEDIGADCIKTGMLHQAAVIDVVAAVLAEAAPQTPVVVDPVMVAKGGAALLDPEARDSLVRRLLPLATLLTPNLPEAESLLGRAIPDAGALEESARALLALGPRAVLLKGGHLPGERLVDVLVSAEDSQRFEGPRIATRHTHGTGCTLASAIAAGLAQGLALGTAVGRARAYVQEAIRTAPGLGSGHGPINHAHTVGRFPLPTT